MWNCYCFLYTVSYIIFIALLMISTLTSGILSNLFFSPYNFFSFLYHIFLLSFKSFFLAFYDLFSNDQFYLYYTDFDVILSCLCAKWLQLCLTLCNPRTVARQAPQSIGFSRQEWAAMPSSRGSP